MKYVRAFIWPFIAFLLYLVIQVVASLPMGVAIGLNPNTDQSLWMSITLLVSSIITAIVLLVIPHYDLRHSFKSVGCKYEVAVVGFIALLVGLFSFDILSERLNLENLMEELFMGMSKNVFGMLAIGLFGPICEEIVFRGGIMRPLLKKGLNPWIAIFVSRENGHTFLEDFFSSKRGNLFLKFLCVRSIGGNILPMKIRICTSRPKCIFKEFHFNLQSNHNKFSPF